MPGGDLPSPQLSTPDLRCRSKIGPDFSGTWTVRNMAIANVPICETIGRDLMRRETTLVVEQTSSEIRVSRRGTDSDGRTIVNETKYSLVVGRKSSASLHGNTLTIRRAVEVLVGDRPGRADGDEEWYFKDNKETLAVNLRLHSSFVANSFVIFYKRASTDQGKAPR